MYFRFAVGNNKNNIRQIAVMVASFLFVSMGHRCRAFVPSAARQTRISSSSSSSSSSSAAFSTTTSTEKAPKAEENKVDLPKPLDFKLSMDDVVSLCKRRGIIFPSSEIYNGYAGFFDYGPIGCELKQNVKAAWWKTFVTSREDVVGVDTSIIHNPETWKSSGTCNRVGTAKTKTKTLAS